MSTRAIIRRVSYSEILGAVDAQALLEEYSAECSIPQIGEIKPQPATYAQLEAAGFLECLGVFDEDEDRLIGFAAVLAIVNPHYGEKLATVESLFVAKLHRAGGAGVALIEAIEQHARQAGCVAILYTAPAYSRFAVLLAAGRAYSCTNLVYCRRLAPATVPE